MGCPSSRFAGYLSGRPPRGMVTGASASQNPAYRANSPSPSPEQGHTLRSVVTIRRSPAVFPRICGPHTGIVDPMAA